MSKVNVIEHPLVQHKLSLMRQKDTSTGKFRTLMKEISLLLGYEVTRTLPLYYENIETPLSKTKAPFLEGKHLALISILRAGNGILDGLLQLMPSSKVGHIGLYRETKAKNIVEYYCKFPKDLSQRRTLVVDPILATGQSAAIALSRVKSENPLSIDFISLISSQEGIKHLQKNHPDINIFTAAIDEKLDDNAYIVPGIGDAGDRLFGTL